MMVDLVSQPRFFVETTIGLYISKAVDLAISEAILPRTNVAIGFFELTLW